MELSTESLEAACKLAYELGQQRANNDWDLLTKEASMQAVKAFGSGLKGVATGQGATMGQAFQAGVQGAKGAYKGPANFRGVVSEIGSGLAKPWQSLYQTFGARQGVQRYSAVQKAQAEAGKNLQSLRASGKATPAELQAAQSKFREAGRDFVNVRRGYGGQSLRDMQAQASRRYGDIMKDNMGTMAAGVGLAGAGGYAAFGGGSPTPPPQVAPHQYYLNQLSNMF